MTNATSNSKGQANLILHYNAELRWLHLRMGQELSHKSVFWVGCHIHSLSQPFPGKQEFPAIPGSGSPWSGREMLPPPSCRSRSCLSQQKSHSQHTQVTPFWGNSGMMKIGGHFKALTRNSHTSHARGALTHHPSWGHLQTPWPPPVTPHCQRNWLKEEEPYENTQFQPFLKLQPCCGLTA